MVKISLDHLSEFPHVTLLDDPETTQKEKELFKTKIIPSMQKEINIAFQQYQRNSTELAKSVRETMNHNEQLEKARYVFAYYEFENKLGIYWYEKSSLAD